ncbi:MAG TPA: hypothetical protein VFH17_00095, partial [Coriobacteriia bacterium]|nr:hypothetical protein [Coriobacteriia bacterium]
MSAASPWASGLSVARWCVYLVAGLVPVAASYYPGFSDTALPLTYDQYVVVKFALVLALAGVGLGAWLVTAATEGVVLRRVPAVEYAVGALLVWASVSTLLSVHRPTAVLGAYARYEGLVSFFAYAVVAFLALQVLDSPKRLRECALVLVASGSLVAVYGLLQSLGVLAAPQGTLPFEAERAFSTFGNPTMLGVFLLMPLALALALALTEGGRRLRAVFWLAFSVCGAALLLTFTRAA